ncbi:hypothetical protein [Pseudomonas fluorescens]|uniref:Uncharacterized protein n=1 Tax=Pseudomonas fluorescens TaxID=294 RepID=A0A5E7A9D3_PSEFL|nr:hypothetical protein [Pseudomonas fluorescens]VVN75718.1 hypothetical protein PS833_00719 [Pseudomonas fluorescens]
MSTAPFKSLLDEQVKDINRKVAIVGFGLPFNELIGRDREFLVANLPAQLATTMKGKRIAVRVRS